MKTIKERYLESNLPDYIYFWKRKDVSLKFKILNMLSGDTLRPGIAFPAMSARQLKSICEDIFDPKYEINWDNPTKEDIELIIFHYKKLRWEINHIHDDLLDLFLI